MIVLKQNEYADKKLPQTQEELRELLKAEGDRAFKEGKKRGQEESRKPQEPRGNRRTSAPERRRAAYDKEVRARAIKIKRIKRKKALRNIKDNIELNLHELKSRPKAYLRKTGEKLGKTGKAAVLGTGIVAAGGLAYGSAKAIAKKRKNDKVRKAVRGYDN